MTMTVFTLPELSSPLFTTLPEQSKKLLKKRKMGYTGITLAERLRK